MPEQSHGSIFYDPKARRWKRFKLVLIAVILALAVIFGLLALSVVSPTQLPALNLPSARTVFQASHVSAPETATATPTRAVRPQTPRPTQNREKEFQDALNRLRALLATPQIQRAALPTIAALRSPIPYPNARAQPTVPPTKGGPARSRNQRAATSANTARLKALERYLLAQRALQAQPSPSAQTPLARAPEARLTPTPFAPPMPGARADSQVIAFYVNWDDTAYTSLKQNISRLDKVIPEWLHLADADGTIVDDDPNKEMQMLALVREQRPQLAIEPLVNNFSGATQNWEGDKLAKMLATPSARSRAIQYLLGFVRANSLQGISIDFENLPDESQPNLRTFMRELYAQFHPLGLEVSQSIPLEDDAYDLRVYAASNDYIILMAYDEHWSESEPGPVMSLQWLTDSLRHRLAQTTADKIVVAVGNYGYDWVGKSGADVTFQDAIQIAHESDARIAFDAASLNPHFDYSDDQNKLHHVWYLDAVTAFNQLVESQKYGVRGFALWRLGSEDPSLWNVLAARQRLDKNAVTALGTMRYGYDIDYEGRGEILKISAEPNDGARDLAFDAKSGMIVNEMMRVYPSPYVVTRYGGKDKKKIALTFDDGPDAFFTPRILDVLKQSQVPATFFITGVNGDLHSDLLQRIVVEGHEIGNHTFTHPDVSVITPEQFTLELNATERLIESRVNRQSLLFRPPYGEDVEPETPDQVRPLVATSALGYYTIGMGIDPRDWHNPGIDTIVQETIKQAVRGDGNIVLLHDGGGDRTQTLAALPQIIAELRAQGYEFVLVSDLMGLGRDQAMPPLPSSQRVLSSVNDAGFGLMSAASSLVNDLFLIGIILGVARMLFIGLLAIIGSMRTVWTRYPKPAPDEMKFVSVIVPAFNEEKVIAKTIRSLLRSTWPNFDILVVDDGSRDGTVARLRADFGNEPRVRVFTKPNEGKAAALNFGIQQTNAEIIVAQDADTVLQPDAIEKLVRHFTDARVGAVAGNTKVGNRINLLTRWQALEYITSQNLDRRAFAVLNCITVVPGAIGAWRRELMVNAGGFTKDTLAEDADLTLRILRAGNRIDYEPAAIARTEAPDTIRGFVNQRFRWMYGTLQAAWKHRDTILKPRYGALGLIALPNVFIFQILFPLISPVMDLLLVVSLAMWGWQSYQHPLDPSSDALVRVAAFYIFFVVIDFLGALLAFVLEPREDWGLLFWLFFQRFLYRQLMYYVAIKSMLTAIRGTLAGWGKLERKATVRTA